MGLDGVSNGSALLKATGNPQSIRTRAAHG